MIKKLLSKPETKHQLKSSHEYSQASFTWVISDLNGDPASEQL